jgi:DNA-binding winged helix-turn-helix (wHTH) protein
MRLGFDEFEFDSDTRELLRHGEPVTLSPKAFHLLEILIESRPKALSKSTLHDRLWPDAFVVEANLSNLVGEVRRALGDDRRRPRFIRTVHRFGYAFRRDTVVAPAPGGTGVVCRVIWGDSSAMLREGDHIIGRDADAAILLESPSVSRRHARIRVEKGQAVFEDLHSKNGSSVQGRPALEPVTLADGDVITAGVVKLTFRMVRPPVPTESVE